MGGGGKNAASKEADRARQEEEARQLRIRQGTQSINAIFDGGTVGTGRLDTGAAFDPNQTYYLPDGTVWTPPSGSVLGTLLGQDVQVTPTPRPGSSSEGGDSQFSEQQAANMGRARAEAAWRKAIKNGLFTGVEQKQGMGPEFFDGIQQGFVDFARPQVDEQVGKAREQLTYALARNGTLDSTIRTEQNADLQREYDRELQNVTDQARKFRADTQNSVEQARADLIANLNATGDATGATNAALSRAQILSTPPSYSPIGDLFTSFTGGLAQQAALERAEALTGGRIRPRYNTGLFGVGGGAVKTT